MVIINRSRKLKDLINFGCFLFDDCSRDVGICSRDDCSHDGDGSCSWDDSSPGCRHDTCSWDDGDCRKDNPGCTWD